MSGPVPGLQTNQRAELEGVRQALQHTRRLKHLLIVTDSEYAMNSATTWREKWEENGWRNARGRRVANLDLIRDISHELNTRKGAVKFEWIAGHKGDEGNERADQLAREAAGYL
eukprot:Polyplicarium_translucidae@DN1249_c0_g1_i1.p2